jgi:RNA polymerase sigma-70 factor (ECF subfamily)
MLRIPRVAGNSTRTLKLEGKLLGPWVGELRRECAALSAPDGIVCLDLSAVTFADGDGVRLLRELLGGGVTVTACSALVGELLQGGGPMTHLTRNPLGDFTASMPGEAELLERARAGDGLACEVLVRQHGGRMLAVARRLLRSEEDAADAVQDAFLAAFRSLDRFGGHSAVGTWLHRIVVNACLMKLRTRGRHRAVPIDELLPAFDETGHHARPVRPWGQDQADALLARDETRQQVRACIDQLPEAYRTVLLLRDIEELDTDETARRLGINAGAVKTRLHRARQALRTLLEPLVLGEQAV